MALDLARVRNLLIDMDGVLYRGKTGLPGGPELFAFMEMRGINYMLVTNNSTASPAQFVERLAGMGMQVPEERVWTSGVATASYLATLAPAGAKVNVVGEPALEAEITRRGFRLAGRDAEYVVCGWDKTISFEKLKIATLAIRAGATFIGTNPDKTYPLEEDIIPGAGSIIAAVVAATDVEPTYVGKPEAIITEQAMHVLGAEPQDTAVLGDRLETDILGGYRAGIGTILVLTGISSAEEAASYSPQPDLIVKDLPALIAEWERALHLR